MYHEVRLRSSIFNEDRLRLLKYEKLITRRTGIFYVTGNQRHPGALQTTNVRVVWNCDKIPNFNISAPLIFIAKLSVSTRDGVHTLTLTLHDDVGGFIHCFCSKLLVSLFIR